MSAPFHVNYYVAPRSEAAERVANIKNYYFMQGIRAVIPRELDNDDQSILLMTYLHNVEVNFGLLNSTFTET